jgi:N-acetylmuramoyl-L-alanine amidase
VSLWACAPDHEANAAGNGAAARLPHSRTVVIGHSVRGRPIEAVRFGDRGSRHKALVVGNIHGDEPAGVAVIDRLERDLRANPPQNLDLWLIESVNPDGLAAGTRKNANGVDLNRNFSVRWSGGVPHSSGYYPGPRPFSEPESRAVRDLVLALDPQVSIWFHQPWGQVLAPCHGPVPLQGKYSRISGLPLNRCRAQDLRGTAIDFENTRIDGSVAFVVELPGGSISAAAAARNARAVAAVTGARRSRGARHAGGAGRSGAGRSGPSLAALKPPMTEKPIPYGPKRKREMARYSKRHYGKAEWRLLEVKTIVEHVTASRSFSSAYNTFANDAPDVEFHELPGVCAHYIIDRDGTIYHVVPLTIRCRHVVGLNYISVGIEHVGIDDADVLGDKREMHSSFQLTRWLRCRFGVPIKYVIGHNESLSSPFYRELVPAFKGQTHGDWRHAHMQWYRRNLRALGGC